MISKSLRNLFSLFFVLLPTFLMAQNPNTHPEANKEWIVRSNSYTKLLIDIDEKYSPEFGSGQGIAFYDTLIAVPTLANKKAERKEKEGAVILLKAAKQNETSLAVKQDLDILINQSELNFRQEDFELNREVSFLNATSSVFSGIHTLLDDQTPVERRSAALVRLNKYAGMQNGYQPLTVVMQERTIYQMTKPDMIYPSKQELDLPLSRNASIVDGIRELFIKYQIKGWEPTYAIIKKQLEDYDQWVSMNILPKARSDFRMPAEKYKMELEGYGIDIPPAEIAKMAHAAFNNIQDQMKPLAEQIAKKYNLPSGDYREVIQYLKKKQVIGDSIMNLYSTRLKDVEEIIRKHHLVTLPNRPAIIRLASAAETAQQPAPHMVAPPFLHNTGQRGVFVLPLNMPAAAGEKIDKYDDFTFEAASWTIIAHEVRPGHELQFDKMVEEGVSQAARSMHLIPPTLKAGAFILNILPFLICRQKAS